MVAMTDRMQHVRLDLQKRVDECMEETKGYKADDNQTTLTVAAVSDSMSSAFLAIDRESMREEKRLNKIMSEACKQMDASSSKSEATRLINK